MQAADRAGIATGKGARVAPLAAILASALRRTKRGRLLAGDLAALFAVRARQPAMVPLVLSPAKWGLPSPANEYLDAPLDFNELLVSNPWATFAVKIPGASMQNAGLFPDDIAAVDGSLSGWNGCVVLALLDGEFTIKRFRPTASRVVLRPENRGRAYRDAMSIAVTATLTPITARLSRWNLPLNSCGATLKHSPIDCCFGWVCLRLAVGGGMASSHQSWTSTRARRVHCLPRHLAISSSSTWNDRAVWAHISFSACGILARFYQDNL